jgi:hypothetical protein
LAKWASAIPNTGLVSVLILLVESIGEEAIFISCFSLTIFHRQIDTKSTFKPGKCDI